MTTAICSLYQFRPLASPHACSAALRRAMGAQRLLGTLLVAPEGINGTIAGAGDGIRRILALLQDMGFDNLCLKRSTAKDNPFRRMKVRTKAEIVTMGAPDICNGRQDDSHISPARWNELAEHPDTLILDVRNHYETALGTFVGAQQAGIRHFRDFPQYAASHLQQHKHKNIAMFCTGGIRCEKSTAWLRARGFAKVWQLHGGILAYMQQVPAARSLWRGACFVFDGRVALLPDGSPSGHLLCHACRMPVADAKAPEYEPGVSCPSCHHSISAARRAALRERRRQMAIASEQGGAHLGDAARKWAAARRRHKRRAPA